MRVISGSAEAGLAGGRGERAQIGGGIGVERAVGGPVQTGVAIAFGLAGNPVGQLVEPAVSGVAWCRVFVLPLGFQEPGDGGPVQGAVAAGSADHEVGLAADLGGRGHDVTAGGTEVEVVAGEAAIVLVRASKVGVHSAGRGPYVGGGAVDQADAAQPAEGQVAVPGLAVLVDVQDVGAGGAGGDG